MNPFLFSHGHFLRGCSVELCLAACLQQGWATQPPNCHQECRAVWATEFDMELSVPAAQGEVMDGYEVASLCCPQIRGTVGTKLQQHITVLAAQGRQGQSCHCVLKPCCYLSSSPLCCCLCPGSAGQAETQLPLIKGLSPHRKDVAVIRAGCKDCSALHGSTSDSSPW